MLVASADGVGTKLRVAFMAGTHRSIGVDLVNHCVNDILVQGAEPLFFLDYLATGRLDPDVAVQIVEGLAEACRQNGCALLGGETAEMPGFYKDGEVRCRRVHRRDRLARATDRRQPHPAGGRPDWIALVRTAHQRLLTGPPDCIRRRRARCSISRFPGSNTSIGEALLIPHRTYLPVIRPLLASGAIKGMAHITGGGITENLPRILPAKTQAVIDRSAWRVPAIFEWLQQAGDVPSDDMLRTFNMGIGLILAVAANDAFSVLNDLRAGGETGAATIGVVRSGDGGVVYS